MNNIYITCAPFKIECSGDYDYLNVFKNTYNNIFNKNRIIEINCKNNNLQNYYINELTKNVHSKLLFMKAYKNIRYNKLRKYEIQNFLNIIKNNGGSKLIIQYRAPETGCLFYPEDINLFKKNNIEIIIVCHEFYINILRSYLKNMTIKVLNNANIVYFFNEIDYKEAVKYGFKGIHYFTRVPILLNMPDKLFIPTLKREENILYFGLIRPSKGIFNVLSLVKLLYEKKDTRKVIIIGKCEMDNILIKRWIDKINIDVINNKFEVNNKYSSNLEIYINPNDNLLFKMANRCQFAYKPDAKGFAYNSSSLINILYLGCILITKSSIFTPSFLLESNSKYCGAIIFQDKKTNNILNNKVPDPLFIYNKITNLTFDKKKNIIKKIHLLLTDYFNKINIVKDFNNNLVFSGVYGGKYVVN